MFVLFLFIALFFTFAINYVIIKFNRLRVEYLAVNIRLTAMKIEYSKYENEGV
ncbi:hypothetical protein HMPREF0501_00055 [Limosilactobacillus coleohominis 101-4-CHN]|uniref:Uncharacterized protein n=1 Tax=Limosilactobacillus coleohominis 101-4-CHN TaxID=575594 RepID=C7XTN9_9LACO|nr:hypothetical protein HMPREF0501_00055 [Limosilactobacillus coleohominis 101-4-CHN]